MNVSEDNGLAALMALCHGVMFVSAAAANLKLSFFIL
jgi:hypothetical protein